MSSPGAWRDAAPAPRGVYPPFAQAPPPPPPMPDHALAGASRQSYYAAPIPGFYSPALAQPAPALPLARNGAAPPFPRPELPPSLMPGRKSTYSVTRSQSDDYFFTGDGSPFAPRPRLSPTSPPVPRKPDFSQSQPQPPLPPKPPFTPPATSPGSSGSPPLPYGRSPRATSYPATAQPLLPSAPPAAEHEDDVVLNRVLEMSAQESKREREEAILSEEAQLALALEASMQISSPRSVEDDGRSSFLTSSPEQGPSTLPVPSPVLDISHRSLEKLEVRRSRANPHVAQQIMDDEALALQLAQEEERLAEQQRQRAPSTHSRSPSQFSPADGPPQYHDAVSSPPVASPGIYGSGLAPLSSLNVAGPSCSPSPPHLGRSASDKPIPPRLPSPEKRVSRSQSVGESAPSSSTYLMSPPAQAARPASIASSEWEPADETTAHTPPSAPVDMPANTQYLDAELLAGLTMGFGTPSISPTQKPFAGAIPNVIALPYGRCPPFHIKAPSWRTLLKLMARLSGTRIEPTMEAMAVVKTEMRLRVVVSFVKVHHASSEWHTVLYMTIDHPIPANAPAGWRYRNGDTSTLPWSYTLSQVPAFLRDGADAPLSKFYTIPGSADAPFPALPISFPNLATYLASALEGARDAMHDSSSGVRRLAKYVDTFYPNDRAGAAGLGDDAPERAGMRQRLKNLVGIGSRPQRDRNAEMYELVTPFVPDEYGR